MPTKTKPTLCNHDRLKIVNAVTTFDRKQSTKPHYNRYAIGMYLGAISEIAEDIENGSTLRQAIIGHYLGRLCDAVLRATGQATMSDSEARHGSSARWSIN